MISKKIDVFSILKKLSDLLRYYNPGSTMILDFQYDPITSAS